MINYNIIHLYNNCIPLIMKLYYYLLCYRLQLYKRHIFIMPRKKKLETINDTATAYSPFYFFFIPQLFTSHTSSNHPLVCHSCNSRYSIHG